MKPLGVTETIRLSGIGPDYDAVPEAYMRAKAQLGNDVHSLCAMAATGKVKLPKTEGGEYARKFCQWVKDSGATIVRTEFVVRGQHEGILWVGHADLEIYWRHRNYIVDIKTTGALYSSYGVQLAAYAGAVSPWHERAVLWIRKSGQARFVCDPPVIRELDYQMWKAILTSRAWQIGAKL